MLLEMIPGLVGILDHFRESRISKSELRQQDIVERNELMDAALNAIYVAASETRIYLEKLKNGDDRDRKQEENLGRLWTKASIPVRHFDKDLAQRCFMKSDAWIRVDNWDDERVSSSRIGIDEIFEDARKLLLID